MLNKNIEFGTAVFCTIAFFLGLAIATIGNHKIETKRDEAKVVPIEKYKMHDLDYHTPDYDISKVV
jgi:hypothetical protein|tara:strand:- start:44 stop:241 length:198 start_codon:yes stop_codon:yes gene_type:complete